MSERHDHKCPGCGAPIDCDFVCCENCDPNNLPMSDRPAPPEQALRRRLVEMVSGCLHAGTTLPHEVCEVEAERIVAEYDAVRAPSVDGPITPSVIHRVKMHDPLVHAAYWVGRQEERTWSAALSGPLSQQEPRRPSAAAERAAREVLVEHVPDLEVFRLREALRAAYAADGIGSGPLPAGEREDAERWRFIREHLFVWPEQTAYGDVRPFLQMKFGHGVIPSGVLSGDTSVWPEDVDRAVDAWRSAVPSAPTQEKQT